MWFYLFSTDTWAVCKEMNLGWNKPCKMHYRHSLRACGRNAIVQIVCQTKE